jgi:uncharacterized phage protein (TIGR02220 family)
MDNIVIPINFFKAIGEKPAIIRVIWIKWLAEYSERLTEPNFCEYFHLTMKDKKINLETINEAYELIRFFDGGLIFTKNKKEVNSEVKELVSKVITYLNEKSGATYSCNKVNTTVIAARYGDGFTISDFKRVIDKKCLQWLHTTQEKYLRPITLFQNSKFENYLNEPEPIADERGTKIKKPSNIEKLANASSKAKKITV